VLITPSPSLQAHSHQLRAQIAAEITHSGGAIGFDRYMDLCLYAPGLGYYSAGLRKFGHGGDFVTAPELGPVFAFAIAEHLGEYLRTHPGDILEVGCGTGALAAELLLALAERNALPARYLLLERSADLRQRQQETIKARAPHLLALAHWLDAPPDTPWHGVLLGNEIVDALAHRRFVITELGAQECLVGLEAEKLVQLLGPPCHAIAQRIDISALPLGYCSEFQDVLTPWLCGLTENLVSGLVLLFDYGYARKHYYLAERTRGTLICHYQQQMFDDPFWWPGLVDISASVDFTTLAEAGLAANLELLSYQSQAQWILPTLPKLANKMLAMPEREWLQRSREIRTLTLPGEMGERMQLMAWQRGLTAAQIPAQLHAPDWRHQL
jgi:SAM-dependent MidA family methyltransferase